MAVADSQSTEATKTQRRPDRGDPGRRDRGRVPRRAAGDLLRARGRPRQRQGAVVLEVQQHLGDDRVRAVAMDSTDGLARGMEVSDTGGPITVPVGKVTLGRIFNLLGEPIDEAGDVEVEERWPIHRPAPTRRTSPRPPRCSRPASRSSTCWRPTPRAARSACSAAPASARRSSSRSSSTTSPRSTAACRPSAAWASAPARATTSGWR